MPQRETARRSARWLLMGLMIALPVTGVFAGKARVVLRAYINVSSGCQAATVEFLNALADRYKPDLRLEIIDFGDRGRGFRRWREAGYGCEAIEINGSVLVKFPVNHKSRAIAFLMPAGFNWTHKDLEQAVQAALAGQLRPATPQEVEASAPPRKIDASIKAATITRHGQRYAAVIVNGHPTIYLPASSAQVTARIKNAATVLKAWLTKPVKLSELSVQPATGGWKILAKGRGVITVTAADVKALGLAARGTTAQTLATAWRDALKHALVARSAQ